MFGASSISEGCQLVCLMLFRLRCHKSDHRSLSLNDPLIDDLQTAGRLFLSIGYTPTAGVHHAPFCTCASVYSQLSEGFPTTSARPSQLIIGFRVWKGDERRRLLDGLLEKTIGNDDRLLVNHSKGWGGCGVAINVAFK